jgi:hypothetical protein
VVAKGRFEVALFGWQFDPDPAGVAAAIYSCGGVQNYTGRLAPPR